MKPPKSRKVELAPNATGGGKSHAEIAESAELKMTELGPIPVDWEVKRLGEVVNILDNRRVPLCESQRKSGTFPYCGANGIVDYIDRYEFDEEAILIAEDGGNFSDFATRSIAYKMSGKYWVNNHAHVLTAKAGYDLDYLLFHLSHKDITDLISGGTRAKLTRGQLENIIISLPPLAEQRRIAGALSDVDELISALGKLIEKKRNIKTGVMQQLLTGKTRLPGFGARRTEFKQTELGPIPVDWEVKRLGDVVNILDNRRVPLSESQRKSGTFPYCGANGIVDYIDRYEFDEESILIAEDGGNFSDFANRAIAYKMSGKYWVNNHAHVLTAKAGCDLDYLLFHLSHKDITDIISGGTRAKLTRGQLENIIISLPPLAEQKAIAAVLSDMDAEIAALEADRAKYERIKSGMMQELLTGKTRLRNGN